MQKRRDEKSTASRLQDARIDMNKSTITLPRRQRQNFAIAVASC